MYSFRNFRLYRSPGAPSRPAAASLETMVRAARQEWFVEACFRDLKQEVGLADCEARKWRARHHHVVLCMQRRLSLTMMQTK
jgi:SRSO17 transposase